jgi:hypothetical protein
LRSTWSPRDHEAFLSFLVDPEHERGRPNIFAVKASAEPPAEWQTSPQEHTLYFGRGWRQQIGDLVGYLSGLRGKGAV